MSHECNKYIIKNDTFVREFEEMYRDIDDPWDQEKNHQSDFSFFLGLFLMRHYISQDLITDILDVGCASGYHSTYFRKEFTNANYFGSDISISIIDKAQKFKSEKINFGVDNIVKYNNSFTEKFDLIFSSKTLYYVAPEIDEVISNINSYLKSSGYLFFIYNMSKTAFTKKWLTHEILRKKLLSSDFSEITFVEMNRFSEEVFALGLFQKI